MVVVVVVVMVVREEERNGGGVAEASLPPAFTTSHCPGAAPAPGAESRAQKRKGTSGREGSEEGSRWPWWAGTMVVALAGPLVGPPVPPSIELSGAPGRPTRRASRSHRSNYTLILTIASFSHHHHPNRRLRPPANAIAISPRARARHEISLHLLRWRPLALLRAPLPSAGRPDARRVAIRRHRPP